MFGMGFSEILIILVIGIIFLGPDKLPEAMVKIAKFFNMFKKTINEAKESIDQELKIEELKREAQEYKKKLQETTNSVKHSVYMDEFENIKNSTTSVTDLLNDNVKEAVDATKENKDNIKKEEIIEEKKETKIEKTKEDKMTTQENDNV